MEVKITKDDKEMMQVELVGENATFANLLKDELAADPKVVGAAYVLEHPLTKNPMVAASTSGKTPKKAFKDAAASIQERCEKFAAAFKKAKE